MFSIGEALILLTATISPFLNVKEMFSSFFLSTFEGLWGTSIGGKETLGSRHNIPENAYPSKVDKKKEEHTN